MSNNLLKSPISLNSIQSEFGGSNPISINEYYRGTWNTSSNIIVPPYAQYSNSTSFAPTSGAISFEKFIDSSKGVAVNTSFDIASLGPNDPYLAITSAGVNIPVAGVELSSNTAKHSLLLTNVFSSQDMGSGSVGTEFYFKGNKISALSNGRLVNLINGRSLKFPGSNSVVGSTGHICSYTPAPADFTYYRAYSTIFETDLKGTAGANYPNDGVTQYAFMANPLGFNSNTPGGLSVYSPVTDSVTYFTSFLLFVPD